MGSLVILSEAKDLIPAAASWRAIRFAQNDTVVRGLIALLVLAVAGCGTSIHDEAARGDLEKVTAMLAADPSLVNASAREPKLLGKTPLFFAVTNRRTDVINLLIERGADVNFADKTGLTPLHVAASLDLTKEAEQLLDAGATIEARDSFGDTPLHIAAIYGSLRMIDFLLDHGADANARNNQGRTPLDSARQNRKDKAAERLQKPILEKLWDEVAPSHLAVGTLRP